MRAERPILYQALFAAFVAVLAAVWLMVTPAIAQDQPTEEPAAAEQAAPAEDAPAEEEAGPEIPAGLETAGMPIDEFELRLLPLTADQLAALADVWLGNAKNETQAVVDATVAAQSGDDAPSKEETEKVVTLTEARDASFLRLTAVVDSLEKKGGDEAAVASFRAYRNAVIVEEKQRADWRTLLKMASNWATSPDGGLKLLKNAAIIVVVFAVLMVVARIVRGYARRLFARVPDLSKLLQAFLSMVIYWITIAIGLMVVLSALGVDITPLFALVGGASFIVAFAMQDTLGNLASGLMIMFNRPFDEGDYITAGGTSGTVKSVSVVSTTVTTPDNQVIVIPNSKVWGDVITNTTASDVRRVDMTFGIGYDDSIAEAQEVLEEVVLAHPLVLKEPAPVIRVGALADSSVNFIVRPWTKGGDYWTVLWDLNRSVKEAFDARGISIPFPQTDMHIKVEKGMMVPAPLAASSTEGRGRPEGATDYKSGDDGEGDADTDQT